jgi:hypothetical protein
VDIAIGPAFNYDNTFRCEDVDNANNYRSITHNTVETPMVDFSWSGSFWGFSCFQTTTASPAYLAGDGKIVSIRYSVP